ncbi:antibiotic biosynthesis monooxygenase family protein [Chryseolinea sp. T2]|uniref:antibiotic biosynthesis monooxygenase family protein n=1 Tax=Chryseolinea sp. T2 TaxID=3129255 RepID=UPI0030771917
MKKLQTGNIPCPGIPLILAMTLIAMCFVNAFVTFAKSVDAPVLLHDTYVVITRYEVQEKAKEQIGDVLSSYVHLALADGNNIMAEVYQEEEQPFVLWVLERWKSKGTYQAFFQSTRTKEVTSISGGTLFTPVKTYYLKDLAPLSKDEWRRAPANEDKPVVIMLFVDSKPGTEGTFAKTYDTAMPQFRSEPGVITYGLAQSLDDKTQFVTYEKFRSEDAFRYHLGFPPIQPVLDYLNTSIKKQPFQTGLHRLVPLSAN